MTHQVRLNEKSRREIEQAVDELFDRLKFRYLGPQFYRAGKKLGFIFRPSLTLEGLYNLASQEEGVKPSDQILKGLLRVASGYLEATRESTKAQVIQSVAAFLHQAQVKGIKTDVPTVLGGQLSEVFGKVTAEVKRIVQTESNTVKNFSILDAVGRISAMNGQEDPVMFFVVKKSGGHVPCEECVRLHLMPDGITPRLWKMSELNPGYHKKGQENPSVGGTHPNCLCVLTSLQPGYSFNQSGRVEYRAPGHDELKKQRGQ